MSPVKDVSPAGCRKVMVPLNRFALIFQVPFTDGIGGGKTIIGGPSCPAADGLLVAMLESAGTSAKGSSNPVTSKINIQTDLLRFMSFLLN
jgi:hypothetical protein